MWDLHRLRFLGLAWPFNSRDGRTCGYKGDDKVFKIATSDIVGINWAVAKVILVAEVGDGCLYLI